MWQIFILYKICLRKVCHSETISILTSHPHCWVPEHFYHPQTKPRTHELSLPVTPPSTHNLWQAHLLSVSVDLHVLDILYKWSSTVGYEAFHTWLCHSAWCLQGSSCCSLCVNAFFFNMAKPCSIVWIYHILCTHSSVDGHFLPPEPLGFGRALGQSIHSQISLIRRVCWRGGLLAGVCLLLLTPHLLTYLQKTWSAQI